MTVVQLHVEQDSNGRALVVYDGCSSHYIGSRKGERPMNMTFTHVHFHFAQVSEGHILCIQGHGGHVVEESISALFNKSHQATGCIDVNFPASK